MDAFSKLPPIIECKNAPIFVTIQRQFGSESLEFKLQFASTEYKIKINLKVLSFFRMPLDKRQIPT